MKIGVRLPPCRPVDEMAAVAARAEALGFESIWVPDSQLLWRDAYATLAMMATRTKRVTLGTAVTNVGTRHPSVVASAIRTVQELAPGRVRVGLGVGDSALRPIGRPHTTQAELRAGIDVIRALGRGDSVDFGAGSMRVRDAAGVAPVYIAANGPRNLALAGELADGVILLSGMSRIALARSLDAVTTGARRSGRDPDALEVVVSAFAHVTDDVARDARLLKPICAAIAQTGGGALLALAGIEAIVPPRVPEVYPDLVHAEAWDRAVDVCGQWITDADARAFAETFCLFGTEDVIVDRIRATADAGATALLVQHVGSYDLPVELMETFGTRVLGRIA